MARLKGVIDFTGKIGGLSAYKRKDMDETIVRTRGGASKKKIKTDKNFERTRELNSEWKGCGKAAGSLRWALLYVKHLSDYNFTAEFSKLCKVMQAKDTTSDRGRRSILISQNRDLLEGFRLTLKNPFDGVVRFPLKCEIDRETNSAWVQLPNLTPDINFYIPWQYPVFRFVFTLRAVQDLHYNYPNLSGNNSATGSYVYTAWQTTGQPYEGERIELELEDGKITDEFSTLILAVGLEMGMPISNTVTNIVKRIGCAKILALG